MIFSLGFLQQLLLKTYDRSSKKSFKVQQRFG
ncbi:hypothetical protein V6Z11_A12G178800 [Gossypium hirsutum]